MIHPSSHLDSPSISCLLCMEPSERPKGANSQTFSDLQGLALRQLEEVVHGITREIPSGLGSILLEQMNRPRKVAKHEVRVILWSRYAFQFARSWSRSRPLVSDREKVGEGGEDLLLFDHSRRIFGSRPTDKGSKKQEDRDRKPEMMSITAQPTNS